MVFMNKKTKSTINNATATNPVNMAKIQNNSSTIPFEDTLAIITERMNNITNKIRFLSTMLTLFLARGRTDLDIATGFFATTFFAAVLLGALLTTFLELFFLVAFLVFFFLGILHIYPSTI